MAAEKKGTKTIDPKQLQQSVIIPLSQIEPNKGQIPGVPANPRSIDVAKFKKLKVSIEENPEMLSLREVLVYQHGDKYVIIGGNMRYRALKEVGYKEAVCKVIPQTATAEQLRAVAIKDNNNFGDWDFEALANLWNAEELDRWGVELPPMDGDVKEDEAEEDNFNPASVTGKPKAQEGDIYRLGRHRLICGDSTEPEVLQILMGDQKADLLLTDPPYNVDYSSKNEALNAADKGNRVQKDIANDKMEGSAFQDFLFAAFNNANPYLKPGGAFYIWHAGTEGLNFKLAVQRVGWELKQILIWVKNNIVLGRQDYQWKHEPCLYGWKDGAAHLWTSDRRQTTVLEFNKPNRNGEHPTMKPVELFEYQMLNSTNREAVVLDLFGGSGTTMIAAEKNGRSARLMELDPRYCDVIVRRWQDFTGQEATLEADGRTFARVREERGG